MKSSDEARRRRRVAAFLTAELLLGLGLAMIGSGRGKPDRRPESEAGQIVRTLELTDLAIGSGAAYLRHPSAADLFAPHSEQPGGFEHQPTGSLVPVHPRLAEPQIANRKESR